MMVAYAISRADLVIIPTQGSQLDAAQAAKAIKLIRQQEKAFGRPIPYAILFTRTSAAIRPRTLQHIQDEFRKHGVLAFDTHMHERDAFRASSPSAARLKPSTRTQVSNLESAVVNARAFAGEVVAMLRREKPQPDQAAAQAEVA